jgi:alanine dehydrogenase
MGCVQTKVQTDIVMPTIENVIDITIDDVKKEVVEESIKIQDTEKKHELHVSMDEDLMNEFKDEIKNCNEKQISFVFHDIVDDKHMKYMDSYDASNTTLFWGLGIENETYLMLSHLLPAAQFRKLIPKRERYSVNYFNNFKPEPFASTLNTLRSLDSLTYPVYINSHTFQSTDPRLQHRTLYDEEVRPNPAYTESIHDILMRENAYYQKIYDKSFVFDGDSIEFITQNFYNATVDKCVNELIQIKQEFQREVFPFFNEKGIGAVQFPDHNYGLVTMLSTFKKNLLICNNGTHHLNITLPTLLKNGIIVDKNAFARTHLTYINCIQMVEPLFVACYGTPDVLSMIDSAYSMGSLRVSLSRYISLQTFNTSSPVNGKLLLMPKPADTAYWYNQLKDSPYLINQTIGYDINFNKFKNHGVEIRFFEWFPEEYLIDVANFFILLAQHSLTSDTFSFQKMNYNSILQGCVQKGFTYQLSVVESNQILEDLHIPLRMNAPVTAHKLLCEMSDILYERYHNGEIVRRMSPNMKKPCLVNYNYIAFQKLHDDIFGKPELIIRAEMNPSEMRTPIIPAHLATLHSHFTIIVESSATRCYSDEEYKKHGARIVPVGYWTNTKHSYIIGLKGIAECTHPTQTLLHFAHCFKGQEGWQNTIANLQPCTFIDYEYMVDSEKKRIISFCGQSGKIGAYLALMAFYRQHTQQEAFPPFDENVYQSILQTIVKKPTVLLLGYGKVGKAAKEVLDQFQIPCTIITSKGVVTKDMIHSHSILLHAIRLSNDITVCPTPFLTKEDLLSKGQNILPRFQRGMDLDSVGELSVICDISCDLGNPRNTLPIYDEYTTHLEPVRPLQPHLDLIAISNLPSLEPTVSSDRFSSILVDYLPDLKHFKLTKHMNSNAMILHNSYDVFRSFQVKEK